MNKDAEGSDTFAGGMCAWQLVWGTEAGKNVEGKPKRKPNHSPCDGVQESFPRGGCAVWKGSWNGP